MESEGRKCLLCHKTVRGRSDKKFCNDHCRNAFNNQHRDTQEIIIKNINQLLSRNRNIMKKMVGEDGTKKVNRELLALNGFTFRHFTHMYRNRKGEDYFFCYDYGWLRLGDELVLIVKEKEDPILRLS